MQFWHYFLGAKYYSLRVSFGMALVTTNPIVLSVVYVLFVSLLTFALFAWDKYCAIRGYWRVSEFHLLLFAFLGGSLGAIAAQRMLRHKTRKEPFRTILLVIATLHLIAAVSAGAAAFTSLDRYLPALIPAQVQNPSALDNVDGEATG